MESEAAFWETPGLDWNNGRGGVLLESSSDQEKYVDVDVPTAQATLNVGEMPFIIMNSL